jgi:hypothetical protein
MPERFIIDAYGVDTEAVQVGFRWLVKYAAEHGLAVAGLVTDQVSNARNLERDLGGVGRRLYEDRQAVVGGVTVRLRTVQGGLGATGGGPLLAVWAADKMIEVVERADPPAICAIPWGDGLVAWRAAHSPADLRTGAPSGAAPQIADPLVALAMEGLTKRANRSAPLAHPSDKNAAGTTLKTLIGAGAAVDPAEIEAWVVATGWPLDAAAELAGMARKILDGGPRRVRAGRADSAQLQRWRDRLTDSASS